jgi:Tfp pilus assembly protein PilF
LAEVAYERAYRLDTTNLMAVQELWEFYVDRDNAPRVFELEERFLEDRRISVEDKIARVKHYTLNDDIYRKNYFRIGRLIYLLTIHYPTNREVVSLYTMHLYLGGQKTEALDYLHRHLEDDNVTAEDYILAIQLDEVMGEGMQYILDMDRGVELFPENPYLVSLSAYMHTKFGAYNSAIKLLRWALKYSKNNEDRSSLWCTIGDTYHKKGKDKQAFKAYEKALDYNPENALALNNYAYFLALTGERLEEALAMAQLAITLAEGEYNYIDTYAWILHLLGRDEEAKKYMTQALSLSRQREPNLLVHYADILWELGEKFMAETYWKKAISLGYDAEELDAHIEKKKSESK